MLAGFARSPAETLNIRSEALANLGGSTSAIALAAAIDRETVGVVGAPLVVAISPSRVKRDDKRRAHKKRVRCIRAYLGASSKCSSTLR